MRYLTAALLLFSAQLFAIGESCNQIWTQAVTNNSAIPAWANCFANHPDCYNVTGATNLNSLPATLSAGDYFLNTTTLPNNLIFNATSTTVRIFVNGSLEIRNNVELNWAGQTQNLLLVVSGSLTIGNNVKINGFVLVAGDVTMGNSNNVEIKGGFTGKRSVSPGINTSATFDANALSLLDGGVVCGTGLSCFNDNFQSGSLNSANWVVSSNGAFTPAHQNGRLRMTEAKPRQATAASFQRLFPGDKNLVVVEFDHFAYGRTSSEGADGMAVVLSDASITPQPGAYGGPLGYGRKAGIAGFAGGWLGVGLDEYGNFSGEGSTVAGPGRRKQSVALRGSGSGETGYRYLAGTCNNGTGNTNTACLNPTVDNNGSVSPAHRYRVTVDSRLAGQAMVKVERRVGGTYATLIDNFNALNATGQAPVPANFMLSFTGSTGDANNFHEIDDVQVCAINSSPVGEQIDHFEFSYTGQALTCKDETFTIRACKNAACSELVTGTVSATLTPTTGWVSGSGLVGNVLTFSGGTATATLRQNTPITVKVGVSGSTPLTKPLSTTLCRIGPSLSAAHCNVEFSDSGFVFDVPNKLAAKPANGIVISALKKGDTLKCEPTFTNVSRVVEFWSDYVDPVASAAAPEPFVSLTYSGSSQNIGNSSATASKVTLNFNADGKATMGLNYSDAGELKLNARYTGSAATQDEGRVLSGSDSFVSAPAGFCVKAPGYCAVADHNCTVMAKAGETFNLDISAHAWQQDNDPNFCDNGTTPSFAMEDIGLQHKVLAPTEASGGKHGFLTPVNYDHQATASATTVVSTSISEVGVFELKLQTPLTYHGWSINPAPGSNFPPASNGAIPIALGRLVPASFELVNHIITPGCGTFSYMGQNALLSFSLEARNQQGAVTKNYFGNFAKATAVLVAENNNDGVDRSSRLFWSGPLLSWNSGTTAGTAAKSGFDVTFNRLPVPATNPTTALHDGPFRELNMGMLLTDYDGEKTKLNALDLLGNTAKKLATAQDWRYGRMVLLSAIGPEQGDLPVQVKAEYFNGGQFVPNVDDSCSPVDPARLTAGTLGKAGPGGLLQQGISGPFDLRLLAPVPVSSQLRSYEMTYDLDDHPWLKYDWKPDRSANGSELENPIAEAVFGGHRGNNRQIFWREN